MSRNVAVTATEFACIGSIVLAYFTARATTADIVSSRKDAAERKLTLALAKQYRKLAKRAREFESDAPFREASAYVRNIWKANGGNGGTCSKMLSHLKTLAKADKGTPEFKTFRAYCAGRYPVSLQDAYKTRKGKTRKPHTFRVPGTVRSAWKEFTAQCRLAKVDVRKTVRAILK